MDLTEINKFDGLVSKFAAIVAETGIFGVWEVEAGISSAESSSPFCKSPDLLSTLFFFCSNEDMTERWLQSSFCLRVWKKRTSNALSQQTHCFQLIEKMSSNYTIDNASTVWVLVSS